MKKYLVILLTLLFSWGVWAKDEKSDQKNKKAVDKEENQFEKNLRKEPNSAAPYHEHANNLAAMPTECSRASGFYLLALKYDSADVSIYKDYGIYLADKLRSLHDAKTALVKGLSLSPSDEEMKKYLDAVNNLLTQQEAEEKLRDFGTSTIKELNPTGNFAAMSKLDSLKILTQTAGNKFEYKHLESLFLADDKALSPEDMYMLIIGFSTQKFYNAFSYNDINTMRMMAGSSIDTAVRFGLELVKVNPLNPSLNRELMYYYNKLKNPAEAARYLNRVQQFFNGVLYSGNGTCERPYISLWSKEEYNFLTYLGYKSSDNHYMGMCAGHMAEIIEAINKSSNKTEPVHFNVGLIYMQSVGK